MDGNGEITEKTIISITVGKNTLEEMQWSRSQSQKRVQNAVLRCNLRNDRMISVISKANHSISQLSKSRPQQVTLKKLKLNSSMKTYKTF